MNLDDFLKLEQPEARTFAKKQIEKKLWTFEQAFKAMEEWRKQHTEKLTPELIQQVFN